MRRARLDEFALLVSRHVDLEPPVAEGVMAKDHPAIDRLRDCYVVIETQHTRGRSGEHTDGALVRVEVIVGAHNTILVCDVRPR